MKLTTDFPEQARYVELINLITTINEKCTHYKAPLEDSWELIVSKERFGGR